MFRMIYLTHSLKNYLLKLVQCTNLKSVISVNDDISIKVVGKNDYLSQYIQNAGAAFKTSVIDIKPT